ncbi:chemotaxis protein CheB [Pseudoduganella namucuonensis]|uniref:protein-glutamate methylesterase n=1 Tax=Pseudoduganella namucuonensis TaxID=1035707 RepID=A0A1I7JUH2_9BURK|nr:chemotaxis protein CheB [Pseudoduganella namucuonensis]SFU88789.1 two-component system, chemotaxis family, response regulator CheB [Pseudoduganella namucuonensis]
MRDDAAPPGLIVIGASAGGLEALTELVAAFPAGLPATVLIVMHVGANRSMLPELLARRCALPVRHARDGEPLTPATVLVAPPDRHLLVAMDGGQGRVRLSRGPKENHTRPAIDPLFRSAAEACGPRTVGVVLTGYLDDGTLGLRAIKACGGVAVVQDPADAAVPEMPASALRHVAVDHAPPLREIGALLCGLAGAFKPAPAAPRAAAPEWVRIENGFARGKGDMKDLKKLGSPSTYTCPDCGGALWRLSGAPPHFRCHTGHSYAAHTLLAQQDLVIEEALWAAVRALQEKARLAEQLAEQAGESSPEQPAAATPAGHASYAALAARAHDTARWLRDQLLARDAP